MNKITKPTTSIVLDIELPFKCADEDFEKIYQEQYQGKISYAFIREKLRLPDSVRLKYNGGFERWLYLLDENDCMFQVRFRVQTAAWFNNESGKWRYVSIFPSFIKKYCQPSLNLLEYISCHVGEGENIFRHIDDPEEILDCEDRIVRLIRRIEKDCVESSYPALLNSRYVSVYNRPLMVSHKEITAVARRFSTLFDLILTARKFFGKQYGLLKLVNTVIVL